MGKTIRGRTILLAFFLLIMLGLLCANIFIDESKFDFSAEQSSSESPDGNYKVTVRLCSEKEVENLNNIPITNDLYIIARIYWEPAIRDDGVKIWESIRSRIIYYDKYNGCTCTVNWADEKAVVINGKTLKAAWQRFDYRFNGG